MRRSNRSSNRPTPARSTPFAIVSHRSASRRRLAPVSTKVNAESPLLEAKHVVASTPSFRISCTRASVKGLSGSTVMNAVRPPCMATETATLSSPPPKVTSSLPGRTWRRRRCPSGHIRSMTSPKVMTFTIFDPLIDFSTSRPACCKARFPRPARPIEVTAMCNRRRGPVSNWLCCH